MWALASPVRSPAPTRSRSLRASLARVVIILVDQRQRQDTYVYHKWLGWTGGVFVWVDGRCAPVHPGYNPIVYTTHTTSTQTTN